MKKRLEGDNFVYTDYRMNETNVQGYEQHEQIIRAVSDRFLTYGYKRIKTSAFEKYDLYASVNRTMNRNEMIKVIDHTGEVLVLRPDITIPLTHQLSENIDVLETEERYFYVQNVFRQAREENESIERKQAGVEYFSERSPEADAEVIALSIHVLKDLGFKDIKIELGHAGYVKELLRNIKIDQAAEEQLKAIIQAKNIVEIEPFLRSLEIEDEWKQAIKEIPLLYGKPDTVLKKAQSMVLNDELQETIDYLQAVYNVLEMYDLAEHIVMDFGLINDMGYYSDTIFQGYVGRVGKPIVMGGRYNELGNRFGSDLPAVGFAYHIDTIIEVIQATEPLEEDKLDVVIYYESSCLEQSIQLTKKLRENNYKVISVNESKREKMARLSKVTVELGSSQSNVEKNGVRKPFASFEELVKMID